MSKRIIQKTTLFLIAILITTILSGSGSIVQAIKAAGDLGSDGGSGPAKYFFYYPEANAKKIEDRVGDYDKDKDGKSMEQTFVAPQGGFWAGFNEQVKFTYDNETTKKHLSSNANDDKFAFKITYTCSDNGTTFRLGDAAMPNSYYKITLTTFVDLDSGDGKFYKESIYDGSVNQFDGQGAEVKYFGKEPDSGSGQPRVEKKPDNWNEVRPCLPYPSASEKQTPVKVFNYYQHKDEFEGSILGAKGSSASGDPSDQQDAQADCDAKLDSMLSWILCPVIDLGVNMSDYVFENFISPFMENVPISTDPRDGTYKAWQQFRIIANVLLIGTLLAIVYAQIKGDR